MKKISVIVPIYNAENYLKRCILSIVNQTYKNLEIILINDGSKDKSEEICKEMAKLDERIKYFYKENTGVSKTRNLGIEKATGDFIAFVDSDDFIDENTFKVMVNKMDKEKLDLVMYNNNYYYDNGKKIIKNYNVPKEFVTDNIKEIKEFQNMILANRSLADNLAEKNKKILGMGMVTNKLFKTNIIKKNNINFIMEGKKAVFEDIVFCYEYLEKAKKIAFYNYAFNNYVINTASTVHTFNKDIFETTVELYNQIMKYEEKHENDNFYQAIYMRILINLCFSFSNYFFYNKNEWKANKKKLKKILKEEIYSNAIKKVKLDSVGKQIKLYYIGIRLKSAYAIKFLYKIETLLKKIKE